MTSHAHIRRGKVHDRPALTRQYFHIHHYFVSITAQFHARLSCSSSCTSACTTGSSFHSAKHFITILFHVADHLIYTRLSFCASIPSYLYFYASHALVSKISFSEQDLGLYTSSSPAETILASHDEFSFSFRPTLRCHHLIPHKSERSSRR